MTGRLKSTRTWATVRRWKHEGFLRAYRRWRMYCEILKSPPVRTDGSGDLELHLLCYREDYLLAVWALKTFYWHARVSIPALIHVQGEPTAAMPKTLRRHFPDARIIFQEAADAAVIPELLRRGCHRLLAARAANPYTLKLTDFVLLGNAPNLLTLDSDVLFFQHPRAFLADVKGHLFQRDPESTYVLKPETALKTWGIEMVPRINVGMMRFRRDGMSLERCDEYLEKFPALNGWLEQTLYALHASERGNAEFLPDEYLISLERGIPCDGLVARHYAGPSRPLLHEEGMPYALRALRDIRNPPPPGTP